MLNYDKKIFHLYLNSCKIYAKNHYQTQRNTLLREKYVYVRNPTYITFFPIEFNGKNGVFGLPLAKKTNPVVTAKTQSGWTFHKIYVIRQYFALVHY